MKWDAANKRQIKLDELASRHEIYDMFMYMTSAILLSLRLLGDNKLMND